MAVRRSRTLSQTAEQLESCGSSPAPKDHLYEKLELGVDLDSRIALVGPDPGGAQTWACLGHGPQPNPRSDSGDQTKGQLIPLKAMILNRLPRS